MHTPRDNTPGVDTGRGATGGGKGTGVPRKDGKPTGPARPKATLTHSTPLQSQGGASVRATDKKVGIIKQFEFNVPCNMQESNSSLEESKIKYNLLEKHNFEINSLNLNNVVQETSQTQSGLAGIVQSCSYARDCTIFGESDSDQNGSFSFNEPISTLRNTKSFESFDEPISVDPVFAVVEKSNENLLSNNELLYMNSFIKDTGRKDEGGSRKDHQGKGEKEAGRKDEGGSRKDHQEKGEKEKGSNKEMYKEGNGEKEAGNKRKGNEDEPESKETKKVRVTRLPKEPKLTFAEKTKGTIVLEVRSSTGVDQLKQSDWSKIGFDLIKMFAKASPKPTYQYGVKKMGCSQGGVWISVIGQLTIDFVMKSVPEIQSPDGCFYTYRIYGQDEKPYKYYKARLPAGLWCEMGEELANIIKMMNWELDFTVDKEEEDEDEYLEGVKEKEGVPVHLRISGGMKNKGKDIIGGYFTIVMEVDERLIPVLIGMNGIISLGHIKVELYAGGIDKAIKVKEEMLEEKRIEEQKERLELIEELGSFEEQQEEEGGAGDTINDVDG